MTESPRFNQVNIVARDWEAALAFYRLLGLDLGSGSEWPAGSGSLHAAASTSVDATTVEFDNPLMVRIYAGERAADSVSAVLGFAFASAEVVDAAFKRVASAGHRVLREPYDAFWGARYAIVQDPDGNAVGLMGPIDRARAYTPEPPAGVG
jgi:catechol 2,3-dioxygenase-like lactoylglutathione lyase family enzyme